MKHQKLQIGKLLEKGEHKMNVLIAAGILLLFASIPIIIVAIIKKNDPNA